MNKATDTAVHLEAAKAKVIVEELNADPADGWTFMVEQLEGSRFASVEVYDEDGEYLGTL